MSAAPTAQLVASALVGVALATALAWGGRQGAVQTPPEVAARLGSVELPRRFAPADPESLCWAPRGAKAYVPAKKPSKVVFELEAGRAYVCPNRDPSARWQEVSADGRTGITLAKELTWDAPDVSAEVERLAAGERGSASAIRALASVVERTGPGGPGAELLQHDLVRWAWATLRAHGETYGRLDAVTDCPKDEDRETLAVKMYLAAEVPARKSWFQMAWFTTRGNRWLAAHVDQASVLYATGTLDVETIRGDKCLTRLRVSDVVDPSRALGTSPAIADALRAISSAGVPLVGEE